MTTAELFMRRSNPGDAEAIAGLVAKAFDGGGLHEAGAAWWHWKYGGNPAGFQGLVAQDVEGRIVGHFGGVLSEVRAEDEWFTFAQGCDTCSDPAVRRGLSNPGVWVRLAQAYTSTYGFPDSNAVMFGMPNKRGYRIGSRHADYRILRQQWLLVADGESPESAGASDVETLQEASIDDDVTALYEHLLPHYRCMARRDARFLRWRFLDAPASPYRIMVARSTTDGTLRGYAVHRLARFMGNDVGILMDWLCDPTDHAAGWSLQAAVREHYARLGRSNLVFVCPTSSPWFRAFQRWGFCVRPSTYMMMALPFASQLEPRFLREHWYYTLADLDLF